LAGGLNKTNRFRKIFGCRRHYAAGTDGTADIANDDIGALFGHTHCVRTTLPASGSSDECDLASETTHNIPLTQ
jgi:acetoin utilization deacetylase AcuC-like enzyme